MTNVNNIVICSTLARFVVLHKIYNYLARKSRYLVKSNFVLPSIGQAVDQRTVLLYSLINKGDFLFMKLKLVGKQSMAYQHFVGNQYFNEWVKSWSRLNTTLLR